MNNRHLSEEEIQVFVLDSKNSDTRVTAHIGACQECLELVNIYKSMLVDVETQAVPRFDFDVASMVLANIESTNTVEDPPKLFRPITLFCVAVFVTVPLYIFRANFLMMANATSVIFLCISLVACVIGLTIKATHLYSRYQAQIETMNMV